MPRDRAHNGVATTARVSSTGQNLDRQLGTLVTEGCDRVFQEKASDKSIKNRPELEKAISALGTGDVLLLAEWDRCTRSMIDGVAIIEYINARGALVKVLDKAPPGPDHAPRQGLPGLPQRYGGGRAPAHRQARQCGPQGCPRARRQVRPQAYIVRRQQADVVQLAARLRSTARSVCAGMSVAIRSLTCACQDPKTTCSRRVCPDALR